MDALVDGLAGGLAVSEEPNDTNLPHPRFSQYKARVSRADQETRRKERLQQQKERRQATADHKRGLDSESTTVCDEGPETDCTTVRDAEPCTLPTESTTDQRCGGDKEEEVEEMVCDSGSGGVGPVKGGKRRRSRPRKTNPYRNQLMLSEWLVDVPENFFSEWLMKVCPVGKRCLVVAGENRTVAYSRTGHCASTFHSMLPGGSRRSRSRDSQHQTILDCIFVESAQQYCVLDVLLWSGNTMLDCESECRFFWLRSRLADIPEVQQTSKQNPYSFCELPEVTCETKSLSEALSYSDGHQVDGLLFYHREAHYEAGRTPLLCWLRPSMTMEIIGVSPSDDFLRRCVADDSSMPHGEDQQRASKDKAMETGVG